VTCTITAPDVALFPSGGPNMVVAALLCRVEQRQWGLYGGEQSDRRIFDRRVRPQVDVPSDGRGLRCGERGPEDQDERGRERDAELGGTGFFQEPPIRCLGCSSGPPQFARV
jgi:hypothetical protein